MNIDEVKLLAFKAKMVEIANRHSEIMRAMTPEARHDYMKLVVERAEVVFGIWQDDKESDAIGMVVIKGSREMQATIENSKVTFRTAAVPCVDRDQAMEAKEVFGDKAN